jgi:DNA invertase Pin-like site-specific DNA recombinase
VAFIGYARVSTRGQDLSLQLDALASAGAERVFQDTGSGTIRNRPQLLAVLDYVREGDTLAVWRLDRLGRSLRHLLEVVADLETRGVRFRSLTEAIDTDTTAGRLQLHIFAALAEFERELIAERAAAGREAAAARGRRGGHPIAVTADKLEAARQMRTSGDLSMPQIAKVLGVGRSTLYRALAGFPDG